MAKRALIVGINDYPGSDNDLRGCLNDTADMADLLRSSFGFAAEGMVVLRDAQATKDAILRSLRTLVQSSQAGDTLVFYYSGHGTQVRDTSGDELEDGMDEVLCPHDFDWEHGHIKDDELGSALAALNAATTAEIILDSCHSGTGTREIVLDGRSLPLEASAAADLRALRRSRHVFRPRYLAPPAHVAARWDAPPGRALPVRKLGRAAAASHVLWAACKPNQYASEADLNGVPRGAFTYAFCRCLREAGGHIGRGELLQRVRASLRSEGLSQVPQLECPRGSVAAMVFG